MNANFFFKLVARGCHDNAPANKKHLRNRKVLIESSNGPTALICIAPWPQCCLVQWLFVVFRRRGGCAIAIVALQQ